MGFLRNNICEGDCDESARENEHQKIISLIVKEIVNALNINYGKERTMIVSLLESILSKKFCLGKNNLFEEYLHTQLELMLPRFIKDLDLPQDTKINYKYASHAKFADVIKAIQNKMEKIQLIPTLN